MTLEDLQVQHLEALLRYALTAPADRSSLTDLAAELVGAEQCLVLLYENEVLCPAMDTTTPTAWLDVFQLALTQAEDKAVFLTQEVLLQPDSPLSIQHEAAALGADSYMRLPLMINHQCEGLVLLTHAQAEIFAVSHLPVARVLAVLVAQMAENLHQQAHTHQAENYQTAIYNISLLISNEQMTLDGVLQSAVNEIQALTDNACVIILLVKEPDSLVVASKTGDLDLVSIGEVFDLSTYEEILKQRLDTPIHSVALSSDGETLGLLVSSGHDALDMLAPLIGAAIEKAQRREEVRRERIQLHALLDHIRAPILVISEDGTLEMANPEAHSVGKRLDLSVYSFIGQPIKEIMARLPEDIQLPADFIIGVPMEVNLAAAGEFVVRIAEVPRSYSGKESFVLVAQEVTRERRLDRAKSELLYILSHDLGNILTLALGYAGLAIEDDLTIEEYKHSVKRVYEALIRARSLIRDVVALDHSYGDSADGRVARPYLLHELIEEVCRVYVDLALDKGLTLVWDVEQKTPQMMGNVPLIKQALENLVTNAIKYTLENGQITVRLTVDSHNTMVTITDTGLGIAREALPHIWERYYRVEEHRKLHIPGTGLGLSLVQSVIKAHHGSIEVESEVGVGSTFRVILPLHFEATRD